MWVGADKLIFIFKPIDRIVHRMYVCAYDFLRFYFLLSFASVNRDGLTGHSHMPNIIALLIISFFYES